MGGAPGPWEAPWWAGRESSHYMGGACCNVKRGSESDLLTDLLINCSLPAGTSVTDLSLDAYGP